MVNVIIELSKYLIILLITLYTLFSFHYFRQKDRKKQNFTIAYQRAIVVLFEIICYVVLFLEQENVKYLFFMFLQIIFFFAVTIIYERVYKNLSKLVLNHLLFLLSVGFIMQIRLDFSTGLRQFVMAAACLALCVAVPFVIERFSYLASFGWFYAMGGIVLLASVFVFGVEKYGAKNWLSIGGILLQPSEFVKILFVLFCAALLSKANLNLKRILLISVVAAVHVGILVLEKDLGGALIFFITYLFVLFAATSNWLWLVLGALAGSGAALIAYRFFSHVRVRVKAWWDPWSDIDNSGYQVAQSLFAIGTGGWFGMGLGRGLPESIPIVESDFIFSAISEEFGGIFCICILLVYLSCFLMFINIAMRFTNKFYKLTALGMSIIFIFQVFLAIGGVTKFIPSTGVTLPLISNGGSSLLSTIIMFSIIQGLHVLQNKKSH